jgi:WD40 repeat protein
MSKFAYKLRLTSLVLVVTSFLAACAPASPTPAASPSLPAATASPATPATATQTPTQSQTPTQTRTPTPTRTTVPTYIPITPVLQGTSLPASGAAISANNADRLTLLARWGLGNPGDIAYTPDGRYLIAACTTGVYFFNPTDYSLSKQIDTPYIAFRLAVSPDSQLVAVAAPDNVYIYQISDLQLLNTFPVQANSLDFSPDGQVLALGMRSDPTWKIQLRNVLSGEILSLIQNEMGIWDVHFAPQGGFVASAGYDTKVWSLEGTLTAEQGPYNSGGSTASISFSPDGSLLAEGSDYEIHIWRVLADGRLIHQRQLDLTDFNYALIDKVAISPDGSMAAAAVDSGVYIWSLESGLRVFSSEMVNIHNFTGLTWSADSQHIAVASIAAGIQVWDVRSEAIIASLQAQTGFFTALAWSPDGQMLAAGAEQGQAYLLASQNGGVLQQLGSKYMLDSLAFAPADQVLSLGYQSGPVEFWTLDGSLTHTLEGYGYGAREVRYSVDGELFSAILAEDWRIDQARLWNTVDWSAASTFPIGASNNYGITGFELAPDQQIAAISYTDRTGTHNQDVVRIVNVPDGEVVTNIDMPGSVFWSINSTAFSPSGTMLAVYSSANYPELSRVLVWRTSDWELLYSVQVTPARFKRGWASSLQDALAWSPDSTLLAVGVSDGTIQILRVDTGELLITLPGHRMWAPAVAFSPDGRLLASCSLDGTIMLWGTR